MSMICFQSTYAKGFNATGDWNLLIDPLVFVFRVINWPIIMQCDKSDYEIETRIYSFLKVLSMSTCSNCEAYNVNYKGDLLPKGLMGD